MSRYERHCIDTYSIKSFADLISMNTQMKSTSADIQKYITPDIILKYFKSEGVTGGNSFAPNQDLKNKAMTMKRAFKALQTFSKTIQGNPFYKDKVTYPIYLEHENKNNSHDYDFILLANDLIPREILDEIKYDDKLTLTFLFIKDMLYPRIPLSKIGIDSNSFSIRSDIAKFIEYSKNNNTDPISAMIKLIKFAGLAKQNQKDSYNGLTSLVKQSKMINQSISNKFFKLFGGDRKTGEIKDVNFLLNEIKQVQISDFFDDMSLRNKSAHINRPGMTHDEMSFEIERQYLAEKTQNYNRILSMVDSLINFNSEADIMVDVDQAISDRVIKVRQDGNEVDLNIDYDKVINSLRTDYFEAFMINLIQKLNITQEKYMKITGATGAVKKSDYQLGTNVAEDIEHYNLEIASARQEMEKIQNGSGNLTEAELNRLESIRQDIRSYENTLNNLQLKAMYLTAESREAEKEAIRNKQYQSNLQYNISAVQNELTGVLHEIESSLYDAKLLQSLFDLITDPKFKVEDLKVFIDKTGMLKINNEQLMLAITDSMEDTIMAQAVKYDNVDESTKLFKKYRDQIEDSISNAILQQLHLLFKRIGRDYGNKDLIDAQKYADLRTERNPIIRKTVTNDNNFKTYILNDEVLLQLYKMLNYADTQKYIAGLIAIPPAKINNPLNIIKYVIKRLGIENNPVFVIGKGNVILSTPDFLSLTGTAVFSKIPFHEMKQVCQINYHDTLWNKNHMFKSATKAAIDKDMKAYSGLFAAMEKAMSNAKSQFKSNSETIKTNKRILGDTKSTPEARANAKAQIDELQKQNKALESDYKKIRSRHLQTIEQFEKKNKIWQKEKEDMTEPSQPIGTSTYRPPHEKPKEDKHKKPMYKHSPDRIDDGKSNYNKTHNKPNNPNQGFNPNKKRF